MTEMHTLTPTGDVVRDTAALTQALTQYMSVCLDGSGYTPFRINETLILNKSGQQIVGIQPWSTVIEWCGDPTNSCVFEIRSAQYVHISNLMIRPCNWGTPQQLTCEGGSTIKITGASTPTGWVGSAYAHVHNVCIWDMWNGVHVEGGAEHRLSRVQLRALRGTTGILFKATQKSHSMYRCIVEDLVADAAHYVNNHIKWVDFNSYSYSLRIDGAALMHGGHGFHMADDVASGDSYPMWVFVNDLECDHNHSHAVHLCAGEGFQGGESWWGSSLTGCGFVTCDAWRGDVAITNTRIYGNAAQGVRLDVGAVTQMSSLLVGDNSAQSAGAHAGIQVGAACSHVRISGFSGDCVGVTGNNQSHGVWIESGAQHVDVSDLNVMGNQKGGYWAQTQGQAHIKLPGWSPGSMSWWRRLFNWFTSK